METTLIQQLGDELYQALCERTVIEPLSNRHEGMTIEDAYHVQQHMLSRRLAKGERVIGKKIGVTSQAVMNMLGVYQPDFGYLLDGMLINDGDAIDSATLIQPKAEGEIAFVLKRDLMGPGVTNAEVLAATECVMPCFEDISMSKRIKCALIGPGNIGTDLLAKLQRSPVLEPVWMVGIDPESDGLERARELGLKSTADGVDGLLPHVEADGVRIAFDATSAYVHAENSRKLNELGVLMIDLTPAAIGPYCVPPVNLAALTADGARPANVNMVTCGGQATIPMVAAVSRVQPVAYGEIVATVSSRSVGPGTRKNIDEFTRTTAGAVERVGGAKRGKAIIIVNPAELALIMRDTVHCLTEGEPDRAAITASIHRMVAEVQKYVPGYRLVNGPVFDGRRVSVFLEVEGLGDYLPKYAGNLDIMTAAAARTAELFAQQMLAGLEESVAA